MNQITTDDVVRKLHRASCIVAHVANTSLDSDEVLSGETLKAAEELILAALAQIDAREREKAIARKGGV